MTPGEVWIAVLLAFLVTVVATPVIRPWLVARQILDWPDDRRSHAHPTPRGGGLAMLLALLVTLPVVLGQSASLVLLMVYLGALGLLGWLDDRSGLPVGVRLLVMTACALALLAYFGPVTELMLLGIAVPGAWLWSGLAVVAVVWLINLHNFMDGSDGLAALQGAWSGAVLGCLLYQGGSTEAGLAGLALAGSCLGFLVWNRPPARLFMGDVGSLVIGGLVGLLAYVGAAEHIVSVWLSLMVCSVFVVDATATLVRRAAAGGQWYTPHREHAYQRLIRSGWSHARVLGLYAALNLVLVLPLVTMAVARPILEGPLALLLVALLLAAWTVAQRRSCTEDKIA